MSDKALNLFDEYATRYAYFSSQEEEWTFSSRGYNKMCTSGTLTNSQGNYQIRNFSRKSEIATCLKIFRIISNEMSI